VIQKNHYEKHPPALLYFSICISKLKKSSAAGAGTAALDCSTVSATFAANVLPSFNLAVLTAATDTVQEAFKVPVS